MTLGLPQIIMTALLLLSLGISIAQHGTPKTGHNNAWINFIAVVINIALLYWGGFYE